jgi:hypothetical protein
VAAQATLAEPPPGVYQRVTLTVRAQVERDGQQAVATVLQVVRPAVDLVDRQIFLTHTAGAGGAAAGFGTLLGRVGGERWTPLLIVDGESVRGDAVPYGATDDAGAFFGGDDTRLVGEWLDVTVTLPGGRADTSSRLIASSAHGPARRSLDARAVHTVWLSAGRHNLLAYAQAAEMLAQALRPGPDGKVPEPEESEDGLWALGVASFPFMVWSDHVVVPSLNAGRGVRVYADSPRVVIISRRQDSRDEQRGVTDYDLLRDRVVSVASSPEHDREAAEKRVWFGMLEGALEHELAAGVVAAAGGAPDDLLSTSALLGPRGVERIGRDDTERIAAIAGDDARAERLRADLAHSFAALVPRGEEGVPARGWWTVAPDGTTRAVIDDGLGGSSYSIGSGGSGPYYRPGSTGSGTWSVNPRTAGDVGRMRWDGSWQRFGARGAAARGGGNEYTTLLVAIAIANILIWSVVAFEIMYYVEQGAGVLAALPVQSTE